MLQDELAKQGIKIKSFADGSNKAKCPKCQPPHKPSDSPLSITIDLGVAVWNCHHCGFRGRTASVTNFVTRQKKTYTVPEVPKDTDTPESLYEWFSQRGISQSIVECK